jgi:hypothetical protein
MIVSMDVRARQTGTQGEALLKGQKGTIWYQVYGTKIPFRIWSVEFFRLTKCTKEPGKFVREYRVRENDLVHYEGAVKIVRKWVKQLEGATALK